MLEKENSPKLEFNLTLGRPGLYAPPSPPASFKTLKQELQTPFTICYTSFSDE